MQIPLAYYTLPAFIFGLIIGSFLNVVIHRVPLGNSIVFPGSQCPVCGEPVRPMDNIPLMSYLLLRGRCRDCHTLISPVYPVVELLTGLLSVTIVYRTGPSWEALLEMTFACVMIVLIFIDARHRVLPNPITYPAFIFALIATMARSGWGEQHFRAFDLSVVFIFDHPEFDPQRAAFFGGLVLTLAAVGFWLLDRLDLILFNKYFEWEEINKEDEGSDVESERRYRRTILTTMIIGLPAAALWAIAVIKFSPHDKEAFENAYSGLLRASAGASIGGGIIWWLRAVYFYIRGVEGMGLGDVKMMSIVGAFLGWQGAFGVLLFGSILGVIIGVMMAYRSRRGLQTALPFGVCLGIASLIVMLMG